MTTVAGIHLGPDTHANRPAATAVTAGTLYYCSTDDLIYISDGSSWSTWADVGGGGGGLADPDTAPSSPATEDDEFPGSSLDAKWSDTTRTGSTKAVSGGIFSFTPSDTGDNFQGVYDGIESPTSAWIYRAKVRGAILGSTVNNYRGAGLFVQLTDGNGVLRSIMHRRNITTQSIAVISCGANGATTSYQIGSASYMTSPGILHTKWMYLEAEWDGSNVDFRYSPTGLANDFRHLHRWTPGATPVNVGLGSGTYQRSTSETHQFEWFRRIA